MNNTHHANPKALPSPQDIQNPAPTPQVMYENSLTRKPSQTLKSLTPQTGQQTTTTNTSPDAPKSKNNPVTKTGLRQNTTCETLPARIMQKTRQSD